MNEFAEALQDRTMQFAVSVTRFCRTLPDTWEGRHVRDQLFRSGTGIAANYHATCRARSRREFISKLGVVIEESDESVFWLTFLERAAIAESAEAVRLLAEGRELLAIFIQSAKTAAANASTHRLRT
jgi:four helix bundle protein